MRPRDDGLEALEATEISCRFRIWNDDYSNNYSVTVLFSIIASYLGRGKEWSVFESGPEDWRSWLVFSVVSEFLYTSAFQPQGVEGRGTQRSL